VDMRTHVTRGFDKSAGMPICTCFAAWRLNTPTGRGTGMCRVNPTLSARRPNAPQGAFSLVAARGASEFRIELTRSCVRLETLRTTADYGWICRSAD